MYVIHWLTYRKGCVNICLTEVQFKRKSLNFRIWKLKNVLSLFPKAQLKELAYSPRNYKRTIPIQYTWPSVDHDVVEPTEDDLTFSQLRAGESLLEIHLKVWKHSNIVAEFGVFLIQNHLEQVSHETFCFYAPPGGHLHPSRAPHHGQPPSRGGQGWGHCDLLYLQPLGLRDALHSSGLRWPTQLQLHVPLCTNSPGSGQAGRSGVKGQSWAPPGSWRGAVCDTWKRADVAHGCHGKERGARGWTREYHRWVMLDKETGFDATFPAHSLHFVLWHSYFLHNALIVSCLIICLSLRLWGWNCWRFGFLGAPVSSCRACRRFGRERSWQANGHTQESCAGLSWLARYWTWGEN